jgi:hypothetical protein
LATGRVTIVACLAFNCVCIAELTPDKNPASVEVTADEARLPEPSETISLEAVKDTAPVPPLATGMLGRSPTAIILKVGVALPAAGPAKKVLAACVLRVRAIDPAPVIGELATAKIDGAVSPTEVTLPDPAPTAKKAFSIVVIVSSY